MCATRYRRPGRGDRGALTLSYVIIVPVFLLAVMVIVQASLWYLGRQAALAAARQCASGYLLAPAATTAGSSQATVEITVTGQVPSLVPGVVIKVSQVARAPVEQFTTP